MANNFNWSFKIICENLPKRSIKKTKSTAKLLIMSSHSFCCYSGVHSKHSKYMNQTTKPKTFITTVLTTYEMLVRVGGESLLPSFLS